LSEILLALGDELRKANHKVGEYSIPTESGEEIREPILFLGGATVEFAVSVTTSGTGGVKVWVINAEGSAGYELSGKITVQLNTDGRQVEVGR
jgi:hypothetical protein